MHVKYPRAVMRSRMGRAGLVLLGLIVLLAVVGPLLSGRADKESVEVLRAPSAEHILGTDDVGHDVWARLAEGAGTSVLVAVGAGILSTTLSALVGISAALVGGAYDRLSMRFVDALLVVPSLVLLILISAFLQPSLVGLIVLISVLHWQGGARVLRARTLSLKERPHVAAARGFGAGDAYVATRHIVPDLGPLLVACFIHRARTAVFMEAGLAFLGLSDPSLVSWGTMIRNALDFYYTGAWLWWLLPPGTCLSVLILSFLFLGHSLETIMEPRLKNA